MKLTFAAFTFGFLVFLGNVLQQNNCCGCDDCWKETPFSCDAPLFDPCGDQFCEWVVDGWEDDPNNILFERPIIKYSCEANSFGAFYINPVQTRGSCDIPVEEGTGKKINPKIRSIFASNYAPVH